MLSTSIIKDENGEPTSIMSIITDITEQKQNREELKKYRNHLEQLIIDRTKELIIAKDRAEESDKLKTSFLANLSHEVRTPMNAIIGFSDLLADPDLPDDQREEYIQLISTSGNDLVHLIDDIVDLSKIETDQLKIYKTDSKIRVIGTRHGEKLFESLVSKEEMVHAINLSGYYCLPADTRDLNYDQFFSKGDESLKKFEEYHSHNTKRLDVEGMKNLLLKLPEIHKDLKM